MSKKDYIAIAKVLAAHRNHMKMDDFTDMVAEFIVIMRANNSRFDDVRFTEACCK